MEQKQQWEDRQKNDANPKSQSTEMNDQQQKQPWKKSNRTAATGKDGVSVML